MYSDDTAICYSSDNMEVITIINSELINLNEWLQGNTLSLNIVKTQVMIIGYKGTKLRLRSHYSVFILIRFCSQKRSCFLLCSHYSVSDRNKYLSIGVHTIPQKRICFSLSENKAFKASNIAVFKLFRFGVHTTELRS